MSARPTLAPTQGVLHPGKPTIAVLLDYMNFFSGGYEGQLRNAFDAKCRELDLNLLLVFGRSIDEPRAASTAHNTVFDLVRRGSFEGVVVVSTLLSAHCGVDGMRRFVEPFRGLPMCSVGLELPGVPSLVIDNVPGMAATMEHMLGHHGYERVAFLGGIPQNPEAELRLRVYRDALARHGIRYDETLVESGYFVQSGGITAMESILSRRPDLQAVVAANDGMALGAIDALRRAGRRVPREIPVTGFDDVSIARLGNPPLTTVAQPFEAMAEAAIRLVQDQRAGRSVPDLTALPTEFIVRQSCGCNLPGDRGRSRPRLREALDAREILRNRKPQLHGGLTSCLKAGRVRGAFEATRLLSALEAELAGTEQSFLNGLEHLLETIGDDDEAYLGLQNAVNFLRSEFFGASTATLDELWHAALGLIAQAHTTAQVHHRLALDENYLRLLTTSEQMSIAFDFDTLKGVLERALPVAGVRTAFISRYAEHGPEELEAFVSVFDGNPAEPAVSRFPATALWPPGVYPADRRRSLLVFPVAYDALPLGVAVFEYTVGASGYHVLRDEISAAVRNVELHQAVLQKTMQHERSVQERLATAKRMQSLSVLAGGVAHDLNNVLGPVVALPDVILRELSREDKAHLALEVWDDLQSIKNAALRATQTIKDLLTLGRQGHTTREALDLNRTIASSLSPESLRFVANEVAGVEVLLDLWPEPLVIDASEAHINRALTNLTLNAMEAASSSGPVIVRTLAATLAEPLTGYETIEPGNYAVVTVSDRGPGIPALDIPRLFEPFFSRKRVTSRSGTGLGLAIVHGVVKEHGGFLDVESAPGVGTTFTLYFPRSEQKPVRRVSQAPLPLGAARLLIIDDEPVQLRTARRILVQHGYRVDTLDSGRKALELFASAHAAGETPCDLVILDMALNEAEDGFAVFENIQKLYPEQRAIIASGHAPTERVELAIACGLAWLPKPYTASALVRAVQAALGQSEAPASVRRQ